ncbi:MAG: c-type cytochrome [Burkholderiaceae bacterium]
MLNRVRIVGFVLALLTSPLALAQTGNFANGQLLFNNNGCGDCHEFLGAAGLQAIRDQIAQRLPSGLTYAKSLTAFNAALTGTDLDNDATGMDGLFPPGTFSAADVADMATFIANMPNPAPILSYMPAIGPVFPPTAAGATASQTVTVTNTGTAPLIFAVNGAAQISTGPFASDFSVTAAQCQGVTLQPEVGNCTVTVQFRPAGGSDTARSASLALTTTTSATPTVVPLFGTLFVSASSTPPSGTTPTTPAPGSAANSPSGGGSLPWHALGLLVLAMLASRGRRR